MLNLFDTHLVGLPLKGETFFTLIHWVLRHGVLLDATMG